MVNTLGHEGCINLGERTNKVSNRSGGILESWKTVGFERRLPENDAEETQHTSVCEASEVLFSSKMRQIRPFLNTG